MQANMAALKLLQSLVGAMRTRSPGTGWSIKANGLQSLVGAMRTCFYDVGFAPAELSCNPS